MIKTVSLTADTETKVEISGGYNVGVINRTTGMLYASRKSGISAGADDVAAIPAGDSYTIRAADDTVYLLATAAGDVQLESIGAKEVFKTAAARSSSGGGGTVDDVARQAIETHANNEKIHLDEEETAKIELINNPNLLINPRLDINQRDAAEYTALGYTVDGWILGSRTSATTLGKVTVTDNGVKLISGATGYDTYFRQKVSAFEKLSGREVTISLNVLSITGKWLIAQYGAAQGGEITQTGRFSHSFTVSEITDESFAYIQLYNSVADSEIEISDIKLEIGGHATEFGIPDPATELVRCQRYYQVRSTGDIDPVDLRPSMAEITDIKQREDGTFEYVAEL